MSAEAQTREEVVQGLRDLSEDMEARDPEWWEDEDRLRRAITYLEKLPGTDPRAPLTIENACPASGTRLKGCPERVRCGMCGREMGTSVRNRVAHVPLHTALNPPRLGGYP